MRHWLCFQNSDSRSHNPPDWLRPLPTKRHLFGTIRPSFISIGYWNYNDLVWSFLGTFQDALASKDPFLTKTDERIKRKILPSQIIIQPHCSSIRLVISMEVHGCPCLIRDSLHTKVSIVEPNEHSGLNWIWFWGVAPLSQDIFFLICYLLQPLPFFHFAVIEIPTLNFTCTFPITPH